MPSKGKGISSYSKGFLPIGRTSCSHPPTSPSARLAAGPRPASSASPPPASAASHNDNNNDNNNNNNDNNGSNNN